MSFIFIFPLKLIKRNQHVTWWTWKHLDLDRILLKFNPVRWNSHPSTKYISPVIALKLHQAEADGHQQWRGHFSHARSVRKQSAAHVHQAPCLCQIQLMFLSVSCEWCVVCGRRASIGNRIRINIRSVITRNHRWSGIDRFLYTIHTSIMRISTFAIHFCNK